MAANEETLGNLHDILTTTLLNRIKSGEATAAELNVARQLLKDNGIDCAPKKGNPVFDLSQVMPYDPSQPGFDN